MRKKFSDPDGADLVVETVDGEIRVRMQWGRAKTERAEVRLSVHQAHDLAVVLDKETNRLIELQVAPR